MSGHPYYGHGRFPPPPPPGMAPPGVAYYPFHPAYFYPAPHYPYPPAPGGELNIAPPPPEELQIADPDFEYKGELVELPYRSYRWVPASTYSIPPGALRVGSDVDGAEIYAGRAHHEGDMIPAKIIPSKNACYVAYGGEECSKDTFEVLVPCMFAWQFSTNGEVPPGAVEVGQTADGEKLYMGRVTVDGHQTPGKIQQSHGCCYYPFGGEERTSTEYECLVLN